MVKQYIYRSRQKIEENSEFLCCLHTLWGEGYYFDAEAVS